MSMATASSPASMDDLRARLREAAQAGEVLRIVYHCGSQPGAARDVAPLGVSGDLMLADDLATGTTRSFKLASVGLLAPGAEAPAYNPTHQVAGGPDRTIGDVLGPYRDELSALGWHVELEADCVRLHGWLKNGRPRKTADVVLSFEPWIVDSFIEWDGQEHNERRPSKRPYALRSSGLPTTPTFTSLSRAVVAFWRQAHGRAPCRQTS